MNRFCAKIFHQNSCHTSSIADRCSLMANPITPTWSDFSAISLSEKVCVSEFSSHGLSLCSSPKLFKWATVSIFEHSPAWWLISLVFFFFLRLSVWLCIWLDYIEVPGTSKHWGTFFSQAIYRLFSWPWYFSKFGMSKMHVHMDQLPIFQSQTGETGAGIGSSASRPERTSGLI